MTGVLQIDRIAPGATVQDLGRPGFVGQGLSQGGAMDRLAVVEAAVLLGLPHPVAGIELAASGGQFRVTRPTRIALTGAPMTATVAGRPLVWHASHLLEPGEVLSIGGVLAGTYGYLTPAGGIAIPPWQGSRSAHLSAGIGRMLRPGDDLALGADPDPQASLQGLQVDNRFTGGRIRVLPGPQTDLFGPKVQQAFAEATFGRSAMANRQGIRLDGAAVAFPRAAKNLVSDFILSGDVQITGDGTPIVLMAECQTIGGYPRIGTVAPADLPIVAQAPVGARLQFHWASADGAGEGAWPKQLARRIAPLVRDPRTMRDLLSYQLIDGVTAGQEY